MIVDDEHPLESILETVWLSEEERNQISQSVFRQPFVEWRLTCLNRVPKGYALPWSLTFYLCCQNVKAIICLAFSLTDRDAYAQIRAFIQRFYAFVEGVSQHYRDIDVLLSKVISWLFISERT
jgi:hypothetical protein